MLGFAAGIVGILAALYVPGFIAFRALRFTRLHAAVAAPLYSAMVYGMLPLAYYELHLRCTVISIVGPALLVAALCYGISKIGRRKAGAAFGFPESEASSQDGRRGRHSAPGARRGDRKRDWLLALAYLACGVAACVILFALNLPTPDAAYIRYDNMTHLNVSKAFLDSGMWSSLHSSRYLDLAPLARPVSGEGMSFYPSLLYALTALCALIGGTSATAAFNAALFALCAVVFPLGMFGIMRVAFNGNWLAVGLGALASVAFAAFPWGVFVRGLFPNAAATCLMAPAIASTMALVSQPLRKPVIGRAVLVWVCALPALALAQPNAVFAAFLFLVAFGAHVIGDWRANLAGSKKGKRAAEPGGGKLPSVPGRGDQIAVAERGSQASKPGNGKQIIMPSGGAQTRARVLGSGIVLVIGLALWIGCMNLPMMHSVVHYFGNTILEPSRAFLRVALLKFDPFQRQIPLAIVVFIGAVACLRKRQFWILLPALWMALAYLVIRTQNNPLAHFLAGFWYCDHVRIAAVFSVFLMPLAAMGLCSVARGAMLLCSKVSPPSSRTARSSRTGGLSGAGQPAATVGQFVCAGLAVALVSIAIFWPNITLPGHAEPSVETGFGTVNEALHNMYKVTDDGVYGNDEQAFASKAAEIAGDDLVLNYPADGSAFSYAANDLKVYYRTSKVRSHNDTAKTIRKGLCNYATDPDVQTAIKLTGAKYLIKLDHGVSFEDGTWFRQYRNPKQYKGIEQVDDDTPGFTIVLSEGDMRLYRIDEL